MKEPTTFYIRRISNKELFVAYSGKRAWGSTGAAKNAFYNSIQRYSTGYGVPYVEYDQGGVMKKRTAKFDEQNVYEIVGLTSNAEKIDNAISLLTRALIVGNLPETLVDDINSFISEYRDTA